MGDIISRPYRPSGDWCCEACVFGRGRHSEWCFRRRVQKFIEDQLVQCLGTRHVVVGYDYVFGKGRQGTGAYLQKVGEEKGFGVTVVLNEQVGFAPTLASE